MRVAVIGSGISGLASTWLIARCRGVWLFERNARLGGRTHTHDLKERGGPIAVDRRLIVFNQVTHSGFCRFLGCLGVTSRESEMLFGVTCARCRLVCSSSSLAGLFAAPGSVRSLDHWRMLLAVGALLCWATLLGPALMAFFLLSVSGIPATEAQALKSRADYAAYQRATCVFVPWPPRRRTAGEWTGRP